MYILQNYIKLIRNPNEKRIAPILTGIGIWGVSGFGAGSRTSQARFLVRSQLG